MDISAFKALYEFSSSTFASLIFNLSMAGDLEKVKTFADFVNGIAADAEREQSQPSKDGDALEACAKFCRFLTLSQFSSVDASFEERASQLSFVKKNDNGVHAPEVKFHPVEAFSSIFAPLCKGTKLSFSESCDPSPLSSTQFDTLRTLAQALKRLELAGLTNGQSQTSGNSILIRPFQLFYAYCQAHVRCEASLAMLMAMEPDLTWYHGMNLRRNPAEGGALAVLPAAVQMVTQINPLSTTALLNKASDTRNAKLEGEVLSAMGMTAVGFSSENVQSNGLKHLQVELRRYEALGSAITPTMLPLFKRLFHPVLQENEKLACAVYLKFLSKAFDFIGKANDIKIAALPEGENTLDLLLEALWSVRPKTFVEGLGRHGASDHRTQLLKSAAYTGRVEILRAFKPFVAELAARHGEGLKAACETATETLDLAYQSVTGFSGPGSNVSVRSLRETVEFLADCGWDYAAGMSSFKAGPQPFLHVMARHYRADLPEGMLVLVNAGCDPTQKNSRGRTALTTMASGNRPAWQQLLLCHEARAAASEAVKAIPVAPKV